MCIVIQRSCLYTAHTVALQNVSNDIIVSNLLALHISLYPRHAPSTVLTT